MRPETSANGRSLPIHSTCGRHALAHVYEDTDDHVGPFALMEATIALWEGGRPRPSSVVAPGASVSRRRSP